MDRMAAGKSPRQADRPPPPVRPARRGSVVASLRRCSLFANSRSVAGLMRRGSAAVSPGSFNRASQVNQRNSTPDEAAAHGRISFNSSGKEQGGEQSSRASQSGDAGRAGLQSRACTAILEGDAAAYGRISIGDTSTHSGNSSGAPAGASTTCCANAASMSDTHPPPDEPRSPRSSPSSGGAPGSAPACAAASGAPAPAVACVGRPMRCAAGAGGQPSASSGSPALHQTTSQVPGPVAAAGAAPEAAQLNLKSSRLSKASPRGPQTAVELLDTPDYAIQDVDV